MILQSVAVDWHPLQNVRTWAQHVLGSTQLAAGLLPIGLAFDGGWVRAEQHQKQP